MAQPMPDDGGAWCIRAGDLAVRLAESEEEVRAAQRLRYRIFYEEMAAKPTAAMASQGRDFDGFDDIADHLLVIDVSKGDGAEGVVGTYRLIRRESAARKGSFYTADEYEIGKLLSYPGEVLELGRSCVDKTYRTGSTMQLLWRGIATYVYHHDIEVMFGCASLPGVNPDALELPLSYLYHYHLAPQHLRPIALPERYTTMRRLSAEELDPKAALGKLPPLIKGYLRLGGFVGDGAVIDHQFHTTDVCVVVKTDLVTQKYHRHYQLQERRAPQANGHH